MKRFEKLFVVAALFVAAIAVNLTAAAVGAVLTPEYSVWENARAGVVGVVAMLIAYPFLKKRACHTPEQCGICARPDDALTLEKANSCGGCYEVK